jgi:uncharacterized protein (DUF1810 family)
MEVRGYRSTEAFVVPRLSTLTPVSSLTNDGADAMKHDDVHDLDRFVQAQERDYTYALAELRAGEKRTHWMWFVFPQLAGLGRSEMARRYAIADLAEAEAYLRHPVLGARLVECAETILAVSGRSAREIFGATDEMKLRSSATLFARAAGAWSVFERVIEKYFEGRGDARTEELLALVSGGE